MKIVSPAAFVRAKRTVTESLTLPNPSGMSSDTVSAMAPFGQVMTASLAIEPSARLTTIYALSTGAPADIGLTQTGWTASAPRKMRRGPVESVKQLMPTTTSAPSSNRLGAVRLDAALGWRGRIGIGSGRELAANAGARQANMVTTEGSTAGWSGRGDAPHGARPRRGLAGWRSDGDLASVSTASPVERPFV